ncbi:MAG TPA: restriction endonuclease subunit S [Verrucomicrobiae bacterium]
MVMKVRQAEPEKILTQRRGDRREDQNTVPSAPSAPLREPASAAELLKGWVTAPVSEVIEDFQPGFASGEKNVAGGVSHLRMNNIGLSGELVLDLLRTVPQELAKQRHELQRGDVLVCTTNSGKLVGKCAYFDLPGRYAFSNHITRLRPKSGVIDGKFLRWNLWLDWKRGVFDDKCKHWVNQSTLPKDALLENDVVLPPLAEQRRIVAKLEVLLGKEEACQQRLAKIPVLLKRFRQSVLAAACSGRLTADWREENEVEEWNEVTLADVIAEKPKNGYSAKPVNYETKWRVLTLTATTSGRFDNRHFKYFNEPIPKDSPLWLQPGDILVQRGNTIEYVGVSAIYDGQPNELVYPDLMIRLRAGSRITTKFLHFAMSWERTRKFLRDGATGTAGNMPKINQPLLMSVPISLPPLAEQQEIVRRVEALFALADQIEARFAKAKAQVDKLTPSLLAKAFRGELVPQDPADEPADKLLERVRKAQKP